MQCHMPCSNKFIAIDIKPRAKCTFHTDVG